MTVFLTCSSLVSRRLRQETFSNCDRSNETHVAELDKFIALVVKENAGVLVNRVSDKVRVTGWRCGWREQRRTNLQTASDDEIASDVTQTKRCCC